MLGAKGDWCHQQLQWQLTGLDCLSLATSIPASQHYITNFSTHHSTAKLYIHHLDYSIIEFMKVEILFLWTVRESSPELHRKNYDCYEYSLLPAIFCLPLHLSYMNFTSRNLTDITAVSKEMPYYQSPSLSFYLPAVNTCALALFTLHFHWISFLLYSPRWLWVKSTSMDYKLMI